MVQKQNGILKKLINEVYKFRFIVIFSVCIFCKGQEMDIINKPFSLEKYSEKICNDGSFTVLQSKNLRKFLMKILNILFKRDGKKLVKVII